MLNLGRHLLEEILATLNDEIEAGVPLVGLEPGCTSVFKDEVTNLLPNNQNARRLKNQTYTLAEFLTKKAPDFQLPTLKNKAVVHSHCHHKAVLHMHPEEAVLKEMKLDYNFRIQVVAAWPGLLVSRKASITMFRSKPGSASCFRRCGARIKIP